MDNEQSQPRLDDLEHQNSPQKHDTYDSHEKHEKHEKQRQKLQALRDQGIRNVNLMGLQVNLDDPDTDVDADTDAGTQLEAAEISTESSASENANNSDSATDSAIESVWQPQEIPKTMPTVLMSIDITPEEAMLEKTTPKRAKPKKAKPEEAIKNMSKETEPEEAMSETFAPEPAPHWQPAKPAPASHSSTSNGTNSNGATQTPAPEAAIALEPNSQLSPAQRLRLRARQIKVDTAIIWMREGKLTSATDWFFEVSEENPHDAPGQQAHEQLIAIAELRYRQGRNRLAISIFERLSAQYGSA